MIAFNDNPISSVFFGDDTIVAAYVGDKLVWQPWSSDDLWYNTYVSKIFISGTGKEATSTTGEMFEVFNTNVEPGDVYKLHWDDIVIGSYSTKPTATISYFNAYNKFISPQYSAKVGDSGSGDYVFKVPENAVYMDIRVSSELSRRGQHFVGIKLFKS